MGCRAGEVLFSITDIVQVLTDSVNPRDYIKKMLRRDPELKSKWGQFVPLLKCWLLTAKDVEPKPQTLKVFSCIQSSI